MVIITKDIATEIEHFTASHKFDKVYVLTDANTRKHCLPLLQKAKVIADATYITIEAGDMNKSIEQVSTVWEALSQSGASRNSLLINVGGGMVTDLGGFAGATFKRGLHTLNIPTTLMASVDAAIGGKTGFNFNGLKNEIGSFYQPVAVLIDCTFLHTLDHDNILSGYVEMIKHGLISNTENLNKILSFDIENEKIDTDSLNSLVETSVAVKERIVTEDPKEQGIRKALNFGHTVGHAIESLSFKKKHPLLHGHAVAAGLVSELYLSHKQCGMPLDTMRSAVNYIKSAYPAFGFKCDDYDMLYELMTHDKKNEGGHINFTLLGNVGDIRINQELSKELVLESLDFYRENAGI